MPINYRNYKEICDNTTSLNVVSIPNQLYYKSITRIGLCLIISPRMITMVKLDLHSRYKDTVNNNLEQSKLGEEIGCFFDTKGTYIDSSINLHISVLAKLWIVDGPPSDQTLTLQSKGWR